jgi:hypothetical protein
MKTRSSARPSSTKGRHTTAKGDASTSAAIPYKLMNVWEGKEIPKSVSLEERVALLNSQCSIRQHGDFPASVCTSVIPMPWYEETIVVLMWLCLFALVLWGPFVMLFLFIFRWKIALVVVGVLVLIGLIPVEFSETACYHYLATLNLKYFSYRAIWQIMQPPGCYIGVQPPHGLFPFGGLLGMFAMPRFVGFCGRGIAASAILAIPIIGHLLKIIGCIDASRENVRYHLSHGDSIGVSTGGIAEIFEASAEEGVECIILKSRGGICKLALQHGVPIVPGYLFGNSKCLHVWHDPLGIMRWLSRKLQVSLVFFWGRWGLPIPYRTPLLSITGDKIEVPRIENPTPEQVQELLDTLVEKITELFDQHKTSFGWDNVKLIVK